MSARTTRAVAQPGGPHGALERLPLEDRDLRLARVRPRRLRARRDGRDEVDRRERAGAGRVRSHGADPRRGLQAARGRERLHPARHAADDRPRVRRRDRGRRPTDRDARRGPERAVAARPGERRSDLRQRRAALVAFEIRGDPDDAVDKIGPVLDRVDVAQQVHPEFFIGEFGNASAQDASSRRTRTTSGRPASFRSRSRSRSS